MATTTRFLIKRCIEFLSVMAFTWALTLERITIIRYNITYFILIIILLVIRWLDSEILVWKVLLRLLLLVLLFVIIQWPRFSFEGSRPKLNFLLIPFSNHLTPYILSLVLRLAIKLILLLMFVLELNLFSKGRKFERSLLLPCLRVKEKDLRWLFRRLGYYVKLFLVRERSVYDFQTCLFNMWKYSLFAEFLQSFCTSLNPLILVFNQLHFPIFSLLIPNRGISNNGSSL